MKMDKRKRKESEDENLKEQNQGNTADAEGFPILNHNFLLYLLSDM